VSGLPNIKLLGTGGTIASRLDYVTGGVIPAFEPGELFAAVPELSEVCNLDTEVVYQIFSEDMRPEYWAKMAARVAEVANSGVDGIMIGHGTDTMSYTTAALSFMLENLNVPVVVVGSQRSSDRPSSDAALNLINAATVAGQGDLAEVVLCMLGTRDHSAGYIHRGTQVRKMHSSVRHTFRTIGDTPLGAVDAGRIRWFNESRRRRNASPGVLTVANTEYEDRVALIYPYPGMTPDVIDHFIDKGYRGIVFAGTGLGHCPHAIFGSLQRATEEGIAMVMTVQTIWGFTGMDVYETGRELQALGVVPGQDMLPEVAFAKLVCSLGRTQDLAEVRQLMQTNWAGEIRAGGVAPGLPSPPGRGIVRGVVPVFPAGAPRGEDPRGSHRGGRGGYGPRPWTPKSGLDRTAQAKLSNWCPLQEFHLFSALHTHEIRV
jgi:glutamyl-tRNA(Gln) amidotransferase subunit D